MKYVVIELQTFDTGAMSSPAYAFDERDSAEVKFYDLVSKAVKSKVPVHAIILTTNEGQLIDKKCYVHDEKTATEATEA
jgi:hypothetical protein